jgi:predicted transcriptional regulator
MRAIDEHIQTTEKKQTTVQTTLYDLIAAIQAATGLEEEEAVVEEVVHLFHTGRIRFLGDVSCLN